VGIWTAGPHARRGLIQELPPPPLLPCPAGVPPLVGLHTAMVAAAVAAVFGAQPGVISGAAGATAVVVAPLVASHGAEYLFAAAVVAGVLQLGAGVARLGKLVRLIPQPVMLGFLNGLALVIGIAQFEQFKTPAGAWCAAPPRPPRPPPAGPAPPAGRPGAPSPPPGPSRAGWRARSWGPWWG